MASLSRFGNDLYTGKRSFDIVGKRKRWFGIAIALVLLSFLVLGLKGLNPGIEFRGGSEFTVSGASTTSGDPARSVLAGIGLEEEARVTTVGTDSLRIQTQELTARQVEEARAGLAAAYGVTDAEITSTFIGPAWGSDVTRKAVQGLVTFLVLVTLVMAAYFRTWRMSAAAVVALIHDLIVTVGLYALVGFEVTPASVIGFLTILGYSLYDTVVVFDKVRENTHRIFDQDKVTYQEAANLAVNQTLVRSINTSVVGILPVASILFVGTFLLGAGTLRDIALALFIGMIISTASSIFLATPLEVALQGRSPKVAAHTRKVLARREARRSEGAAGDLSAPLLGAAVVPGAHQGHAAQPRRRSREQR